MSNARSYTEGLDARLQDSGYAAEYLTAAAEGGKAELLLALRDVVRAHGVSQVAKHAKRGRESLYKALSQHGNPGLDTFLSLLDAMDVKLRFGHRLASGRRRPMMRGHRAGRASRVRSRATRSAKAP